MPKFEKSTIKGKKYSVITPKGKKIHFGNTDYEHFKDKIGLYSHLDHNDPIRRKNYLARAKGIKDKNGNLTWKDPESPNYYAIKYLW